MEFNIGDHVMSIVDENDYNPLINIGTTGTVVGYLGKNKYRLGVEWDVDPDEAEELEVGFHDCDGRCTTEFGWYVNADTVELWNYHDDFDPESFEVLFDSGASA